MSDRIGSFFAQLSVFTEGGIRPRLRRATSRPTSPARPDSCEKVGGRSGRRPNFGPGLCGRCGEPLDMKVYFGKRQHRQCKACHRLSMKATRKRHPMSPEERRKDNARSYAHQYLKRGKIERQPCQKCGAEKAQMHHHDYSKPLEVEWLCRPCHLGEHYGPESSKQHSGSIQIVSDN